MTNMEQQTLQYEVLKRASLFLSNHHRETNVAYILLQHYLQVSRTEFFIRMREPVPPAVLKQFTEAIHMHAETGIPVQHLTGYESFYGREFHVNKYVLIPRPETEELVQHIIHYAQQFPENESLTIVDAGTGSGVIACTLALELKDTTVYATDISKAALTVASQNARDLQADVTFLQGDFLQPLIQKDIKADIIVSNPPYIARSEKRLMSDTVTEYDPEIALFAEENGLAAYQTIISQLQHVCKARAVAAFEIGYKQGSAVQQLLKQRFPQSNVTLLPDINQKERVITVDVNE